VLFRSVPAPPGVFMVAPPELPRNAEGAQRAKAALVEDDGPLQRGQEHKHYKGQCPKEHRPCQIIYPLASGSCMSYRGGQSYVELPRIYIPRTTVNKGKKEGRGV
jgi:hypothetical protein